MSEIHAMVVITAKKESSYETDDEKSEVCHFVIFNKEKMKKSRNLLIFIFNTLYIITLYR